MVKNFDDFIMVQMDRSLQPDVNNFSLSMCILVTFDSGTLNNASGLYKLGKLSKW
jgi:hypothetical protein